MIRWHRACEILNIYPSKRGDGWPDSLNIEKIARLHYTDDKEMERALLSLMKSAIASGSLEPVGADHIPGNEDYCDLLARMGCESIGPRRRDRKIPLLSREIYEHWRDRPPIPDGSPLRGWIAERVSDSRQSGEARIIPYKRPERIKDGWNEVLIAAIKEHEAEHNKTGTETQIWSRIASDPPKGYQYEWDARQKEYRMLGNAPLTRASFVKRFARLYPDRKPR